MGLELRWHAELDVPRLHGQAPARIETRTAGPQGRRVAESQSIKVHATNPFGGAAGVARRRMPSHLPLGMTMVEDTLRTPAAAPGAVERSSDLL
jgi:hypothetical protein